MIIRHNAYAFDPNQTALVSQEDKYRDMYLSKVFYTDKWSLIGFIEVRTSQPYNSGKCCQIVKLHFTVDEKRTINRCIGIVTDHILFRRLEDMANYSLIKFNKDMRNFDTIYKSYKSRTDGFLIDCDSFCIFKFV